MILSKNWFIEPSIDFELKKYALLAWLQQGQTALDQKKIYPFFNEIPLHLEQVRSYKNQKEIYHKNLKKEIDSIKGDPPKIIYQLPEADSNLLQEVEMIINFSIEKLEESLRDAENFHRQIKNNLKIFNVGIYPLYIKEGYLFLLNNDLLKVYDYSAHSVFSNEKSLPVTTTFIGEFDFTSTTTLEKIKSEVTRSQEKYAVPATFVFESNTDLPVEETFLPLAKEMLAEIIS